MKLILTTFFLLYVQTYYSQTHDSIKPPTYLEGESGFFNFLVSNVKYPVDARNNGISGVVYVSVVVSEEGNLDSLWVVKSDDKSLEEGIVETFQSMKKWIPAQRNDEYVKTQINIPIGFYLDKDYTSQFVKEIYDQKAAEIEYSITLEEFALIEYAVPVDGKMVNQNNLNRSAESSFDNNYQKGVDALANGEYKKALKYFDTVYKGDPTNVDILFNRGLTKYKLENVEGACKDWKKAEKYGDKEATGLIKKHCLE
jgi:TonB family protein